METLDIDWIAVSLAEADVELGIRLGAHLVGERDGYSHHGIYVGNGQVIHYGGFHHTVRRRPVEAISLRRFAAGRPIGVRREPAAVYLGSDAVARARSRLGEDEYGLLTNNCEHFCTWCLYGVARSEQVHRCLTNPWTGVKTLRALVRSDRTLHRWASRVVRCVRQVRGAVAALGGAAQLGGV
jgi:cell wall-associated NlpC family hydrolase